MAGRGDGEVGGKAGRRATRQARLAAGLCPNDGNPAAEGIQVCRRCSEAGAGRSRARSAFLGRQPGRCKRCGREAAKVDARFPRDPGCRLCPRCWFSSASLSHFGRRGCGDALAELFLAQGGRCALTGRELVIGRNASLDHKSPVSRGGPRTLANVRWLTLEANMMKHRMHDAELVAECRRILEFLGTPGQRRIERAIARVSRRLAAEGDGC